MSKKITKPKQAASASELDRWQVLVLRTQGLMVDGSYLQARALLATLLLSMRRTERR